MSLFSSLNKTVSILRPTNTATALGTSSKSWTTVYSNVPAAIQPYLGAKALFAGKLQMNCSHVIYMQGTFSLMNGDLVSDGTFSYRINYFEDKAGKGTLFAIYADIIRE